MSKRTKIFPYVLTQVKERNLEKYGHLTCELCKELITDESMQYDHIIPVSKFREELIPYRVNSIRNLQITHRACNEKKSNVYDESILSFRS